MVVALKIIILVFAFIGFMATIVAAFMLKIWLESHAGNTGPPTNNY